MKQSFKFGDRFDFEGYAEFKGSKHKVTSTLNVVRITMVESNHDITYRYHLCNLLPNEHGEVHCEEISELGLERVKGGHTR